jgi:GT2 family glycosyltransferase
MTSYPGREIVVVRHGAAQGAALVKPLTSTQCVQIPFEGPFNFSSMNNRGAQAASGEILVFLNDDVEPLVPEWMALLVSQAQRPEVGVVGARLLYPSGAVQHAGIVIGIMDGAGHPHRGTFGSRYWNWLDTARNVSAVTGACLAIRKCVFDELGGFDTAFAVNYNDVDLCLRAREAGFEVLYEPAAALVHREGQTRSPGTRYEERELLYQRWGNKLEQGDPFYNPNLTRVREDASLRLED